MNLSTWLEVAIGMVALYFLLSTACSTALEGLRSLTQLRGAALSAFVEEMVTGQRSGSRLGLWSIAKAWLNKVRNKPASTTAVPPGASALLNSKDWLLEHPLVLSLRKPKFFLSGKDTTPSYIPSKVISQTLLSALVERLGPLCVRVSATDAQTWKTALQALAASHLSTALLDWLQPVANLAPLPGQPSPSRTLNLWPLLEKMLVPSPPSPQIQPADFGSAATALGAVQTPLPDCIFKSLLGHAQGALTDLEAKNQTFDNASLALDAWIDTLRQRLPMAQLSFELLQSIVASGALSPSLQRSLQSILDLANHDLDKVRSGVERWYDSVMDRATGWFKRRSIMLLFFMGFAVSAALNIDTFDVARQLIDKPALRQRAVTLGETLTRAAPERLAVLTQQTAFVEWVQANQLAEPGLGGVSEDQARKALAMLLRSAEMVGPVWLLQWPVPPNTSDGATGSAGRPAPAASAAAVPASAPAAPAPAASPRADNLLRLAALGCRTRINRTPRDLVSETLKALSARNEVELLVDDYCLPEARVLLDDTQLPATGWKDAHNNDKPEDKSKNLEARKAALMHAAAGFRKDAAEPRTYTARACKVLGLASVSWHTRAATLSLARLNLATKDTPNPEVPSECYEGSIYPVGTATAATTLANELRTAYKDATAGTEQLVGDVRAAYNLLDNVGPLWKVAPKLWFTPVAEDKTQASASMQAPAPAPAAASASAPAAAAAAAAASASAFATWWGQHEFHIAPAVLSLLGWLVTAIMVSFGAPFWFDLLSKLVDRRAAGPTTPSTPAATAGA